MKSQYRPCFKAKFLFIIDKSLSFSKQFCQFIILQNAEYFEYASFFSFIHDFLISAWVILSKLNAPFSNFTEKLMLLSFSKLNSSKYFFILFLVHPFFILIAFIKKHPKNSNFGIDVVIHNLEGLFDIHFF